MKNRVPELIFLAPVTSEEIKIIIYSFNVKKVIGPYSIPVILLKILSRLISQPLSVIVNQSIEVGIFPDKLKVGKVDPLHRKDSSDNPSNYIPISILSVFSKIFEKLMYKHVYQFLDSFEMLCPKYNLVFMKSILPHMPSCV